MGAANGTARAIPLAIINAPSPNVTTPPSSASAAHCRQTFTPSSSTQTRSRSQSSSSQQSSGGTLQAATTNPPTASPSTSQNQHALGILDFLTRTWLGNAIAGLALAFGVAGFILAAYSTVITVVTLKWSNKNDALQSCLSAYSVQVFSQYCNKTIKEGVLQPPLLPRQEQSVPSYPVWSHSPYILTSTVVFTFTAGIFTGIWFRPRMELFRPVISPAKIVPSHNVVSETRCRDCGAIGLGQTVYSSTVHGSLKANNDSAAIPLGGSGIEQATGNELIQDPNVQYTEPSYISDEESSLEEVDIGKSIFEKYHSREKEPETEMTMTANWKPLWPPAVISHDTEASAEAIPSNSSSTKDYSRPPYGNEDLEVQPPSDLSLGDFSEATEDSARKDDVESYLLEQIERDMTPDEVKATELSLQNLSTHQEHLSKKLETHGPKWFAISSSIHDWLVSLMDPDVTREMRKRAKAGNEDAWSTTCLDAEPL